MKTTRILLFCLAFALIASASWGQCTTAPTQLIANCSFEDDVLAEGNFTASPANWAAVSAGAFHPDGLNAALPTDGGQFGFVNVGGSLSQTFTATMVNGGTYTATVDVCVRTDQAPTTDASLVLRNTTDGVDVATLPVTPPAPGNCTQVMISHVATATDDGDNVQLRMFAADAQINFDNIVATPVDLKSFSID